MQTKNALTKTLTVALIFMLAGLAMLANMSITYGADIETLAYVSVDPNPIGVGQTLVVNVWLTPSIPIGPTFQGFTVTFTKPDGTQDVIGPFESEPWGTAANWFEYVPDKVGTWYYEFNFPGQLFPSQTGWAGGNYKASKSPKLELIVQEQPVPGVAPVPLPSEPWQRPIYEENKEWSQISGDWVRAGYDAGNSRFNPYSEGPGSPHILWSRQVEPGGIIGGKFGGLTYGGGSQLPLGRVNIIYYGHTFYRDPDGATHCVNIKTGEDLWVNPSMSAISAVVFQQNRLVPAEYKAYLVSVGSSYIKYNPWTGAQVYRVNSTLSGTVDASHQEPIVYSRSGGRLIAWYTNESQLVNVFSFTTAATTFQQLIKYNVTDPGFSISYISGRYGGTIGRPPAMSGCIDLETGQKLWNRTLPDEERQTGAIMAADEKLFTSGDGMKVRAYDMRTGKKLWEATADYPWGTFWSYSGLSYAYGNVYASCYDGLYCFDGQTGARKWVFKTPPSNFDSPYPGWAMWGGAVIADGKIYQATGEHSPSNPVPVGNRLYCVNATTGQQIWNISDLSGATSGDPKAIADGVLLFCNEYDLKMYAIGKGESKTTVTAPDVVIPHGQSVVIRGTVLDQSPAQPGTPCVSPDSMGPWMEYLNMQKPVPANIVGVPVSLDTLDPNGNYVHIGDVTTDGYSGTFGYTWEPEVPGQYQVTATFMGDVSYGSSFATTYVTVSEAPAATATPVPPQAAPDSIPYIIGVGIAIIIAVAIVGLLILRKKQ